MTQYDMIVIGGGPAGMTAAIFAKRAGRSVLILEKMPKLGKKLLITGAGRCNLLNETLDPSFYKPEARELLGAVLKEFGKEKILAFFKELGLHVYSDEMGRIFPVTNQAASVLNILELELEKLKVPVMLQSPVRDIRNSSEGFEVYTVKGERFTAKALVLAGGGKSYPALGSTGDGYAFAKKFGHSLTEPVPSTVPFLVKDPWCHFLQGQKVRAKVRVLAGGKNEKEAEGELLFTQYGLSGTAILDISDPVSVAMNRERKKEVTIEVDLVPFLGEEELEKELGRRFAGGVLPENLLEGILPHKFSLALQKTLQGLEKASVIPAEAGIQGVDSRLKRSGMTTLINELKHKRFKVYGTRGWNEAEFTAGGIPTAEVDQDLQSKFQEGLYFAGEILDIQAARGGYQLAWAWASGMTVGSA